MRTPPTNAAFSLIELLVVMGIIGILATMSIVAMNGIQSGQKLKQAGGMVLDQFALARQSALSKNARVRLTITSVRDIRNDDPSAFRKMQSEIFDPVGRSWKPLGRAITFPMTIVADPGKSTLLTNTDTKEGATNTVTFLSGGRADLNPNDVFSLTISSGINTNNFITIQLDPVSGRCRTFQP